MQKFIKTLPHRHLNPLVKDSAAIILGSAVILYLWIDLFERFTR